MAAMGVPTDMRRSRTARAGFRCKFMCSYCPPSQRRMLIGRIVGGLCGQSWESDALVADGPTSQGGQHLGVGRYVEQVSQFLVSPERAARPTVVGQAGTCGRRMGTPRHVVLAGQLGCPFITGLQQPCDW